MSTRADLLRAAAARLDAAGVPGAAGDARALLRWASGLSAAGFSVGLSDPAAPEEAARFEAAVSAREARRPVSQIIGKREFWGRDFIVTEDVLDPRPETETLIDAALQGPAPKRILDLGLGSGCILLTLLAEWPGAMGVGVDASAAALDIARRNAAALGLEARADLRLGDWATGIDGPFDLVVSNPPYIAEDEMPGLSPEVRDWEPRMALTPGGDGLSPYRILGAEAPRLLAPGGRVLLECGAGQAEAVAGMLAEAGLGGVRVHRDMDGRGRCVEGRAP
ncbi:peptide chain release factor N(5)-glutamine methyltransferase [Rhodovulum sp. DZ06]|uniref:peptide chain release factor N(5)-glutamine methyltransferase n=1 Tax=Rhodovulum sp. DZ06 TaxID=3425126 RepID=UPI003D33D639